MEERYMVLGIVFALLAGFSLLFFGITLMMQIQEKQKPLYMRKRRKVKYPENFSESVLRAYDVTESVPGMLHLLAIKYRKGRLYERIQIAEDYIKRSRYRDYETALEYLTEGLVGQAELCQKVIDRELKKRKRLPCQRN